MDNYGDLVAHALSEVEATLGEYGNEAAMAVWDSFDPALRWSMFSLLLNRYDRMWSLAKGIVGALEDVEEKNKC